MAHMDDPNAIELFKIAVAARQLEIQLFWQRSNYFLVLNTAAAAGFFSLRPENGRYAILLAIFGLAASLLWFRVNLGGKYWQVRWEAAAGDLESNLPVNRGLFSASSGEIRQLVAAAIAKNGHTGFRGCIDNLILAKPSVSFAMILLSLLFALLWAFLAFAAVSCGAPHAPLN